MRKKILIFLLALLVCISLSDALKTITVNETDFVSLKPKVRDEDADKLAYSFTEPLDENGQWQTKYGDAGKYNVTVTVSDGTTNVSTDVLLVVKKKNVPPVIDSFAPQDMSITINEGEEARFDVEASDLNKDVLRYAWKLDGNVVYEKKDYAYKTDYGNAGLHKISVIVSDGEEEISKEWEINVNKVDREALLGNIKDISVSEGDIVKLELPDFKKYNLEHTISEPIGNDNYWETTYKDSGNYNVNVTISDRKFTASKQIKVEVADKDRAPVFKPIAIAWMEENQKVAIDLDAYDPDDEKIEFFAESLPNGASLEGNKFEWVTDYNTVQKESGLEKALDKFHLLYKPFKIFFIAKSKDAEVKQSVLMMVKDVNRPPVLEDIPPITVNEGEEVVIEPNAIDPDGDNITYSYSGWISVNRYKTNYDDAGIYRVKVTAFDGFLSNERYVTITVNDVNRAPVFKEIREIEIKENEKLELELFASDPDGDFVNISAESLPGNATIKDNVFMWVPDYETVNDDFEVMNVYFEANDGKNETIKDVNITVYNVNRIPTIISTSPSKQITVKKDSKVKFEINATDADGDVISYIWKFGLLEQYKTGPAMVRTFKTTGDKEVKVAISDEKDEAEYEWKVKVV